jgi:hypothetical protein
MSSIILLRPGPGHKNSRDPAEYSFLRLLHQHINAFFAFPADGINPVAYLLRHQFRVWATDRFLVVIKI